MASARVRLMKSALGTMHSLGLHDWLRPFSEGLGMILTLHRVRPVQELDADLGAWPTFNPNGLLEVTPEFLDATLDGLKSDGLALVSLDEAIEAIKNPVVRTGRFAVLTFDDGYIDNRDHALPVLETHSAPAMLYVPSAFPQGEGELWWAALEEMIRVTTRLALPGEGLQAQMQAQDMVPVETADQKQAFYDQAYWALRSMGQDEQRAAIGQMAEAAGYDLKELCQRLILSTPDLRDVSKHPLITIGAHTVTHRAVARLSAEDAMREMVEGANWLEEVLGTRPTHFSFPYGDPGSAGPRDYALARQAGFQTAVTTRKGMLYDEHKDHLFGLPRVSLNGDYQQARYVELFASGAPFFLANRFKKVA